MTAGRMVIQEGRATREPGIDWKRMRFMVDQKYQAKPVRNFHFGL